MEDKEYKRFLDKALRYLAYRPRSEKEVRDALIKKKAPASVIDKIIQWLKEKRFINDDEFARWWIEQRARFKPKGARIIKMELMQKGLHYDIIASAFENIEEDSISEEEQVKKIVMKKIGKYSLLPKQEIYKKLGAFLARRGYSWEIIKSSIDDVLSKGV